ncbi:MAG: hypothetical protein WCI57_01030 [Candidatus Berkelbacteria bacterium]
MDLENVLKGQTPAPATSGQSPEAEITQFQEKNKVNISLVLLWSAAAIAVLGTGLFFLLSSSAHQDVVEYQKTLVAKDDEIEKGKKNANEKEIVSIKAVVAQLKNAEANRFSMVDFLPLFFAHVDKNVTLNTLAVSSEGVISFTGNTDSFKSAAEQVMALKAWKIKDTEALSGVNLGAVSATRSEDGKVTVPIAINATFDKKLLPDAIALVPSTSGTTTGGSNAKVQ